MGGPLEINGNGNGSADVPVRIKKGKIVVRVGATVIFTAIGACCTFAYAAWNKDQDRLSTVEDRVSSLYATTHEGHVVRDMQIESLTTHIQALDQNLSDFRKETNSSFDKARRENTDNLNNLLRIIGHGDGGAATQ